jgi:hypothetical protein
MSDYRARFVNDAKIQVRHENQHSLTEERTSEPDVVQL